jgi:hypothetical protein
LASSTCSDSLHFAIAEPLWSAEREAQGRSIVASRRHVLVVASRTAVAEELREALLARARTGPIELTLLLPAPAAAGEAGQLLCQAVERLRAAGLDAAGSLGEADPCSAVAAVWDPREYDEIVVATLPPPGSHWLASQVPARIARITGAPVATVVARSSP